MMEGPLYVAAFAVATTLALLGLAMVVRRGLAADLKSGNDAQRLAAVGEVLSVFLIAAATVRDAVLEESVVHDLVTCAAYGAIGYVASTLAGRLGVSLLLGAHSQAEVARGNKASGLATAGQLVASALVTSRAISGSDLHGLGLALTFFVLSQATLLVFVSLFRALTTYDDAEQIHGENVAAALSYAGVAVAIAIVVERALDGEGDFEGWLASLKGYGGVLLSLVALWPIRQLFVQTILLRGPLHARGGALDVAIAERRSAGMAALEAATYVATALAISQLA
ncbi:MAG: DUF350 domain-containing protein [Polyangiaceae bacterium]|jgi:uncharacterized membrane protein YjfL (UPF0719 family)